MKSLVIAKVIKVVKSVNVEIHNTRAGNWACFFVNIDKEYIFYSPKDEE